MNPARLSLAFACLSAAWLAGSPQVAAQALVATVVDAGGRPLADAVVTATPLPGTVVPPRTPRTATMEQIDREFVPYVMPVRTGTTVNFPNRDPLMHHVYSFSRVKNFEIKLYSGELPRGIVFDKAGIVTLGCNIHDWMLGYIFVADTPYFAKTDAGGTAQLGELAAGEYDVQAWHPDQRATAAPKPARVDGLSNIGISFTINVATRKPKFKPPLNPAQYR